MLTYAKRLLEAKKIEKQIENTRDLVHAVFKPRRSQVSQLGQLPIYLR